MPDGPAGRLIDMASSPDVIERAQAGDEPRRALIRTLVEHGGFEPPTPCLPGKCSPAELMPRAFAVYTWVYGPKGAAAGGLAGAAADGQGAYDQQGHGDDQHARELGGGEAAQL
jgi:hypothetical protein